MPTDHGHRTASEGLVSHEEDTVFGRELVELVLGEVPYEWQYQRLANGSRTPSTMGSSRVDFDLVHSRDDSGNLEHPLRLKDVKIGQTYSKVSGLIHLAVLVVGLFTN